MQNHKKEASPSTLTFLLYAASTNKHTLLLETNSRNYYHQTAKPCFHGIQPNTSSHINSFYTVQRSHTPIANMGAVVSCFQAIGDCIMAVINAIAGVIMAIVNGVVAVLRAIVRFLTCKSTA